MHWVKNASWVSGHSIVVVFEDGSSRLVDLASHLHGEVFEPLRDVSEFRRFRVNQDTDTIEWPNGADVSPDFLYEIGTPVGQASAVA